jgi:CRISPR-associated protein Cst1
VTKPLLKWTGHPLADVGVATLCAMVGKDDPEKLTLEDLDEAGKELKAAYTDSVFVAYLTCVFPNSAYVNPTMKGESREKAMQRLLFPHWSKPDEGTGGIQCVFSGAPATHFLERSQMPMLTGAGVMNFFPAGLSEMAVAGPYLLAIQALPLGGRRSEGKLLIVHCDDPTYTLQFARKYLAKNRQIISLSQANRLPAVDDPEGLLDREMPGGLNKEKRPKYPDAKAPESLVMSDLVEVVSDRQSGKLSKSYTSVTIYLMSNSGQGPSLSIMNIPGEFVQFLFELQGAAFSSKWQRLVSRAWRAGKGGGSDDIEGNSAEKTSARKGKKESKPAPRGAGRSRNDLYNDLLAIFENGFCDWLAATRFIRRHLLSDPTKFYFDPARLRDVAPRFGYEQLELIDWDLTSHFLQKVLGMNKERIELIKDFATRLAELINQHNDKRLFRDLVFTSGEWQYRAILAKVQMQYAKDRGKLALGFDEYVDVFLTTEPGERSIWSLVRDLISIRLVERLFELKFFDREENREALEAPEAAA